MRKPELVLLMLFIALIGKSTFAQNPNFKLEGKDHQLITIGETFAKSAELRPFQEQSKKIYGLAASAEIDFASANGWIRLILLDQDFNEYLLLESYPTLNGTNQVSLVDYAEETALLNGVIPYAISIEIEDASVILKDLSYASKGEVISDFNKHKTEKHSAQNKDKIEKLNKNLKASGQNWIAGETSVSQLSYGERKKLYGQSTFPAGFEFYAGGVISTSTSDDGSSVNLKSAPASSPYVDQWDWRDRHGKNWMSPVANQSTCGACWAFAPTAATEAMANLYFNQLLNFDLSEQDVLSCSGGGSCSGGYPSTAMNYIQKTGIVDEITFPYAKEDLACNQKANNPNEQVKISGFVAYGSSTYPKTEDDLKRMLIEKGPLSSALYDWKHAMALAGYLVVKEGDLIYYRDPATKFRYWVTVEAGDPLIGKTLWIFKNSWGSGFGDGGYVYVETTLSNITQTYGIEAPVVSTINNYEVVCTDNDGDGYYFWGLGEKPANCPGPDLADGDDSDPTKGPLDEYGYCMPLIAAAPVANFTSTSTAITKGQQVDFTDRSTNSPTSWSWTFEGGTPATSTEQNPTVTYNTTGTFSVNLFVSNAEGNDTKAETAYITVTEPVAAPTANFSATPAVINEGSEVSFTDLTTNEPTAWSWSFEGGTPATSEAQNPKVIYKTPGTFDVTLTVTNAGGTNTKATTNCIQVIDTVEAPVAAFAAVNTIISEGQSVTFADQSTNSPTSWSWTFEGGTPATSAIQNPTVVYATPGSYSVTLIAGNDGGSNTLSKEAYITVEDTVTIETPVADFEADNTAVVEGDEISFTDKSQNNPSSWRWEFEGGNPSISTERNPKVAYNSANSYKVSLTVTNAAGNNTKTVENYVTVEAATDPGYCTPSPVATEEWIAEVHMGNNHHTSGAEGYADFTATTFTFDEGSSVNISLVPDFSSRDKFEYWSIWIDYNTDNLFTENEKVFSSSKSKSSVSGTINIPNQLITTRMRVAMGKTEPTSCNYTDLGEVEDYTIVISEPVAEPPLADFTASSNTVGMGQNVLFTNLSANEPTGYQWYFPGGTPAESTASNPAITYATAGTYDVTLIAYKDGFKSSQKTISSYITVTDNDAIPYPSNYCEPQLISNSQYYIKALNIGNVLNVNSIGDGCSFDTNPFTLNAGSSYSVDLVPNESTSRNFWRIWADFNKDGDFDDSDETLLTLNNKKGPQSEIITIPSNVSETTRIRVAMKVGSSPSPCENDYVGEIEDYLVSFDPQMMQTSMPQSGFESFPELAMKVYPNPTNDILNLQLSALSSSATFALYNAIGEKVIEEQIVAPLTTVSLENYVSGIYVIVVRMEDQILKEKIVKR
ncbi:MAG TPA: PKD domain-containing protein [Draconibacterium sp.]|nr:PKD domain-containing protein [Draconibacterium sp.]